MNSESSHVTPRASSTGMRAWFSPANRKRLLLVFLVLLTAASVRTLTFQFMRARLNDAGWFQFGSYAVFHSQAKDILEGRQNLFLISDPSRTDLVQYPPAYPIAIAAIYRLSGNWSAYSVQTVQWIIDSFLILILISGVATTAFNWRVGLAATLLAALTPLLAMYGAFPSADMPTTWFVLAGNWLLLLAAKRHSVGLAFIAGIILGIACWLRVNPLYLCFVWALALFIFVRVNRRRRLLMSGAVLVGTIVVISPIVIRNYFSFPDFTPTGGTIGVNLWEGLGETELGRQNGFLYGDDKMLGVERVRMGLPPDAVITPQWPDGIRRDRERTRESLAFIKQHPVWYSGVMFTRMWGMLKIAGKPLPYYGSSGINVTAQKCLPPNWQGGVAAFIVKALGMMQSVTRYLLLPLVAFGVYAAARKDFMITGILLMTVLYYLGPGTAAHTEIRYVLPMHCVLIVFGGVSLEWLSRRFSRN